jgi:uncharacterized membrane protein
LDASLGGISYADKKEILSDYEEHFRGGLEDGKTEEEISASLGQPRAIAKSYRADYLVQQAHSDHSAGNILRAILAVMSLSLFNLIVVLGPFMGLVGAFIGLWAAGIATTVAGAAMALAILVQPFLPFVVTGLGASARIGVLFLGVGLSSLGLLACIGLCYMTVWFYKGMVKYLQFNLKIIKG